MKIVVEYAVPKDDEMREQIAQLAHDGDHPGLLEMAWCCPAYTAYVRD